MGHPKDRAENRMKRRGNRHKNHDPLLKLVDEEKTTRPPRKPNKQVVKPLNDAQKAYDQAIAANTITFGIGPAGTGKTWLAAIRACEALDRGEIETIVVTRPAIEAEQENLGFLPGELEEKYEPYLRPVREAFEDYFGSSHVELMIKRGIIQPRPLAFLRGATLKNCWVLADEMQNATKGQHKLLYTRIGENAKFIVNGDPRQCDLPNPSASGLMDAAGRLRSIKSVAVVTFTRQDIVRSGMAQAVVEAYETPELTSCNPPENRYSTDESNSARSGLERFLG